VWVNADEIAQLAQYLELTPRRFEHQYMRRLGLRNALHERASGDCVFFDPCERRCIVYPARPVQCRSYPFWDGLIEDKQSWARLRDGCKGAQRGQRVVAAVEIRRRAERLRSARGDTRK